MVHIRHLLCHTLDLIDEAQSQDLPVVLSLHDYYLACPSIQLLDGDGVFCGGACTAHPGQCRLPVRWLHDLPVLKDGFLHLWREEMGVAIDAVNAVITTSEPTRNLMTAVYPQMVEKRTYVIEHGRDFSEQLMLSEPPSPGGEVKIVTFGHLGEHKGTGMIRELVELDRRRHNRLRFHFLGGSREDDLDSVGKWYGAYHRCDLPGLISSIRPSFAAVFSTWAETYSHTLTEAWSLGLPVLVGAGGAPAERVSRKGGGWVLDIEDREACYEAVLRIADDPREYAAGLAEANVNGLPSLEHMARAYLQVYGETAREVSSP